jgi:hypothetical protein
MTAPTSPLPSAPATIDLSAGVRPLDDSEAHLLRLCLDLQLDAMLLTLGAAASAPAHERDAAGHAPWRRWVVEDVDLACALATEALGGNAALPATLGSDLHHAVPAATVDNLAARYTSMRTLLADLASRSDTDGATDGATDGSWHAHVVQALQRCEARLAELETYRLAATPPRGITLPEERQYLPGELLG